MNLGDFLKQLELDVWYKVCILIGGISLLTAFFVPVQGISNTQLQMLAGGVLLVGLGEWKNHKKESFIKPPNAYTGPAALITYPVRKPDLLGVLLDLVGIALIGFGVVSVLRQFPFSNLWSTGP